MRYTHAFVVRIPDKLKWEEKKNKCDIEVLRKQQADLMQTLREAGLSVVELPLEENAPAHALFAGDAAVMINGTALLTRPKKPSSLMDEYARLLRELSWTVVEAPINEHGKAVILEGSDVLYTGREVFVGINRKNGTNVEGAMVLARVFPDVPVVPLPLPASSPPLTHHVAMAAADVIAVGRSKESQSVIKRMEAEATFRYKTLTVEDEQAVACMCVNDRIVFRQDKTDPKFTALQSAGLELWALDVSELSKCGDPFTRHCLLVRQMKIANRSA